MLCVSEWEREIDGWEGEETLKLEYKINYIAHIY